MSICSSAREADTADSRSCTAYTKAPANHSVTRPVLGMLDSAGLNVTLNTL